MYSISSLVSFRDIPTKTSNPLPIELINSSLTAIKILIDN